MTGAAEEGTAGQDDTKAREMALAGAVKEFAGELRLTDVIDLITFIRTDNHPNLGDLVNSSAELYFAPGTLCYGWGASVDMLWTDAPSVKLDLEFHHRQVTAFFRLTLQPRQAGVDLVHIAFAKPEGDPAANTRCLLDAIREARLSSVAAHSA